MLYRKKNIVRKMIIVACFLVLSLAACGNTGTASTPPATQAATSTPTQAPTPQPAYAGKSAEQIVQALKLKGLPIGEVFIFTAENDDNKLLGRPGQYTSKVEFSDTRLGNTYHGIQIKVRDGGSVETFASVTDAQHRFTYLQSLSTSGNALFAEYEYLDGMAILRVSSDLTPTQVKAYETAFMS